MEKAKILDDQRQCHRAIIIRVEFRGAIQVYKEEKDFWGETIAKHPGVCLESYEVQCC